MRDPIGRWYDAGFDRLNVIVPEQTWEAINKATRDWQATWLKESQEAISADPKASNWDNLSQSLAAYNNAQKMRTRFIYRSIALVSAFILIPWLISDYSEFNQLDESALISSESDIINPIIQNQQKATSSNPELNQLASLTERSVNNSTSINTSTRLGESSNKEDNEILETSLSSNNNTSQPELVSAISSLELRPVTAIDQFDLEQELAVNRTDYVTGNIENQSTGEPTDTASLDIEDLPLRAASSLQHSINNSLGNGIPGIMLKSIPSPVWMLGIKGNLHANTLLNPMTQMENSGVSGVDNRLSYNLSGGITARRYFGLKNSVEADLMFGETRRQFTNDSRSGDLIRKDMSLKYNSLSIVYKRSISPMWKMNEVSLKLGAFGAIRSAIQEKWDGEDKNFLREGYGSTDFGISSGIDYTLVLNSKLRLTTGLQYQLGGVNIFKGLDFMPSNFYQTYTSSFGLTTGLYYCF